MKSQDSTPYYDHHAETLAYRALREKSAGDLTSYLAEIASGGRILDLGCGSGCDLGYFRKAGYSGTGVEASPKLAAIARVQNPGIEIWEKNFLLLSLKEGEWDGVWANRSLHHFAPEAVQRVIGSVRRGLTAKGILGIIVYEGEAAFQDRGQDLGGPSRWIHPFSENGISSMIEQTGFKIVKVGRQAMSGNHPLPSLQILAKKI